MDDEESNIGTIPLNNDESNLNGTNIHGIIPYSNEYFNNLFNEETEDHQEAHNLLINLFSNIIDNPTIPENHQILNNLLQSNIPFSDILYQKLLTILIGNNYPEYSSDIINIFNNSSYNIPEEDVLSLKHIFFTNPDKSYILDLFLNKNLVTPEITGNIISYIHKHPDNDNYKSYLLNIVKSFDKKTDLQKSISPLIAKFFTESPDVEYLSQLYANAEDKSIFSSINQNIQLSLQKISSFLEIERISNDVKLKKILPEEAVQRLEVLLSVEDQKLSLNSYKTIKENIPQCISKLNINNVCNKKDAIEDIVRIQKKVKHTLSYSNDQNIFIDQYKPYCFELLSSNYIDNPQIYSAILENEMYILYHLINSEYSINTETIDILLSNTLKYPAITQDHLKITSYVIGRILEIPDLPQKNIEQAVNILTSYINGKNTDPANNIVYCLNPLANKNILHNDFTNKICVNYLANGIEAEQTLSSLKYLVDKSKQLPKETIECLVAFSLNTDMNIDSRIQAIELLAKTPQQLTEHDINAIAQLLTDFKESSDYDNISFASEDQLTSEYTNLDKFVTSYDLQINNTTKNQHLLTCIANYLAVCKNNINIDEVQLLQKSLQGLITNSNLQTNEYNLANKEVLQKISDSLSCAINIYNHDGTIVKVTPLSKNSLILINIGYANNTYYSLKEFSDEKLLQEISSFEENTQSKFQSSYSIASKNHEYDFMLDTGYWYNETDIQYIANGLIKDYNLTPALGTSEHRTLKQLLEGVFEEYQIYHQPTFIPLNIRENHWVALSIFQHEGDEYAFYKDSLGVTKYKSEREQIAKLIQDYNPNIIFKYHSGQEQEDSSSCGIFAIQNMKVMSEKLKDTEKFIEDFTKEVFTNQQQANQLRKDFHQIYTEQLQYDNIARSIIRDNHYPELLQIKDILGVGVYSIRPLAKHESLNSTIESNTLGIDIALPTQISKGTYQYSYIITATNDCDPNTIIDLLAQKLNIDKTKLIQSSDNHRTIIIEKNLLEDLINSNEKLNIDSINNQIQLNDLSANFASTEYTDNNSYISYKSAKAISKLLESYAAEHEYLPIKTQNTLKEIAGSQADILTSTLLNHIGVSEADLKGSSYLNLNMDAISVLLDFLKSGGINGHTTEETDDLINYVHNNVLDKKDIKLQSDNDITQLISTHYNNILQFLKQNNLYNFNQPQLDNLTESVSSVLDTLPNLFKTTLELIKLVTPLHQNKELLEKLIDSNKLNYQDLCFFAKSGCKHPFIVKTLESHLLDDEKIDISNTSSVMDAIAIIKHLSYGGNILSENTIFKLIKIADAQPNQALNILRIIKTQNSILNKEQLSELDNLFLQNDSRINAILTELFTSHDQKIASTQALEFLLDHINIVSQDVLKILPDTQQEIGKKILKLSSDIDNGEKLQILENLGEEDLNKQIIQKIFTLLEYKDLSTKSIQLLAKQNLDEVIIPNQAREIINSYKEDLPEEYNKLSKYIATYEINEDIPNIISSEEMPSLHKALVEKYPDRHMCSVYLKEIQDSLSRYPESFIKNFFLDLILDKSKDFDDYKEFIRVINQLKPSEELLSNIDADKCADLTGLIDRLEKLFLLTKLATLSDAQPELKPYNSIISQQLYLLKDSGWNRSSIEQLLSKLAIDTANTTIVTISNVLKYKISDSERNQAGYTIFDIIGQHASNITATEEDLEQAIYSIFSNKFEPKLENKDQVLRDKVEALNPHLGDSASKHFTILSEIRNIYNTIDDQSGTKIAQWSSEDIAKWVKSIRPTEHSESIDITNEEDIILDKEQENIKEPPSISKMIAVIQRANYLHTESNGGNGHLLRDSQIISLLLLIEANTDLTTSSTNNGRLLQISTGEGKSIISASLAAILSLLGHKVDIITSSTVLANAGLKNASGFFKLLGLDASSNITKSQGSGINPCYNSDIVYGDVLTFQTDLLSNSSYQGLERGSRELDVVIVDEVDSMLLDGSNSTAKQSSPVPLMEFLLPVMTIAWHNYQKVVGPFNLNIEDAKLEAQKIIEHFIDEAPLPRHLIAYAKHQAQYWASSLVNATHQWQEDVHYVINVNDSGKKVINPVNNSTGVTQQNMVWQHGLHQFLQIKHNLQLTSEGLTTFFISNIAYFQKYQKILGMTGTLGSISSQEFLEKIYGIDLAFMPTHKDKQLIELPPIVANTKFDHRNEICKNAYLEAAVHNRAVLIVGKNIQDSQEINDELKRAYAGKVKIINYSRSEESLYNAEIESVVQPKTIIVATSLAGRGTDIKTSREVEENGGLHVISTYIAKNARDEAQIIGRTARSGNSGTSQTITLDREYYDDSQINSTIQKIELSKTIRDAKEQEYITQSINKTVPSILKQDGFYDKFSELYKKLTDTETDKSNVRLNVAKIKQLKEDFGIWLQTKNENDSIDVFLKNALDKYNKNTFTNPSYPIIGHAGASDGQDRINFLKPAIDIDDIYNFAAHYYTAQGWLQVGVKGCKDYKNNIITELLETANRVSELLSYLTAMNISVTQDTSEANKNSELLRQITAKLGFFQTFAESIQKAIEVVRTCPANKEVKLKSSISAKTLAPALDDDDSKELSFLGVTTIFEIETYKPRAKWLDTVIVGVCSIAQMAIGSLIAIGTLGGGIQLAASVFAEGVKDLYSTIKAVATGVAIKLQDYLTEKAISYAVIGASAAASKISSAATKTSQLATNTANTSVSTTVVKESVSSMTQSELKTELIKKMVANAGVQLVKTVAVEHIVEFVSDGVRDGILDGLEGRISGTISKSVKNSLEKNHVLLTSNHNVEREYVTNDIHHAISKAVKTNKNAHVINSLASGLLSVASKHSGIGSALHAMHKVGSVVDAGTKIEPIMDDIKDVIDQTISHAAIRALERPKGIKYSKGSKNAELDLEQVQTRDSMSKNIGSMVASYLMQSIQGKITTPLINSSVTALADKALERYNTETQKELAVYSETLAKNYKNISSDKSGFIISGVSAGDEIETKKQDKDQKSKTSDLSPDAVLLNKLAALFKMDQDSEVARMLKNTQIGDINDQSVLDIYGSKDMQDDFKPVKIYDVKSSAKIDSNNHGLKKDSFVRNGKEVTSYRNSLGHFSKKPSAYNYSINAQIPLINIGGEVYSDKIINGTDVMLGGTTFQLGMTAYGRDPYLVFGLHNGLSTNIGWQSGILVANADLDNGGNISASIFETTGFAGLNLGKSGFSAKAGYKASLVNAKYNTPISEICIPKYCLEGDLDLETGLGTNQHLKLGKKGEKFKVSVGLGFPAYFNASSEFSIKTDPEYLRKEQNRIDQIQAKYHHFNNEIKHYHTNVIAKIAAMDIFDFSNPEDFESILTLAKTFSKE